MDIEIYIFLLGEEKRELIPDITIEDNIISRRFDQSSNPEVALMMARRGNEVLLSVLRPDEIPSDFYTRSGSVEWERIDALMDVIISSSVSTWSDLREKLNEIPDVDDLLDEIREMVELYMDAITRRISKHMV